MTASNPGGLLGSATGAGFAKGSQEPGPPGLERSIARVLTIGTYASIGLIAVGVSFVASGPELTHTHPRIEDRVNEPELAASRGER